MGEVHSSFMCATNCLILIAVYSSYTLGSASGFTKYCKFSPETLRQIVQRLNGAIQSTEL